MLPKVLLFMIVAVCMIEASYDIYRSSCRRAAIFNIHTENSKLTGDIIAALYADLLSMCVRKCLQAANCRTINYKKATLNGEKNCEILSNDKSSKALQAADGWNYYEALIQKGIPACKTADGADPCRPGFTCEELCSPGGPEFTCTDNDECLSNPCQNGGTCNDLVNMYSCTCVPGYTGINCETDINECSSSPCVNGVCLDEINRFYCTCYAGWTGTTCSQDINECASNPCSHGSCSNQLNRYTCSCHAGWTGTNCNQDINECASSPCQNGGTCHNNLNSYSCNCPVLWGGTNCEKFLGIGKK